MLLALLIDFSASIYFLSLSYSTTAVCSPPPFCFAAVSALRLRAFWVSKVSVSSISSGLASFAGSSVMTL
jgi:hypothetical protein